MKNPNFDTEIYKAHFIARSHKDKKEHLIHITKAVGNRNVPLLVTLSTIRHFEIWNQDVK